MISIATRLDQLRDRNGSSARTSRQPILLLGIVAIAFSVAPVVYAAPTCAELPLGSLVTKGTGGNPASDANIPGIIRDPQPGSLSTKHLTGRIYNFRVNGAVPGGKSSAVAVDGLMYARNAGLNLNNLGDNESSTASASKGTKDLRKNASDNVKTYLDENGDTPKLTFIIAHLVHHFFNGNHGGPNNYTVTSLATNGRMKDHGEKVAIETMHHIYKRYYEGEALHQEFVKKAPGAELYYKPGIIYQSTASGIEETVFQFDTNVLQSFGGDANAAWSSFSMRHLDDNFKKKLASKVDTRIRYILHEYEPAANGTGYQPNGNWYYMPQTVFDEVRDDIFPTDYYTNNTLSSGLTHVLEEDVSVWVAGQGLEMIFSYRNYERPTE